MAIDQSTYMPNSNIYKYTAAMSFILGQEVHDIDTMNIKSIAIDNDYKNANMPMIFVTVAINRKIIDKMVQNQDSGIIILDLQRAIINSDMPDLYSKYINDKFIYFISEDVNKTDEIDYEESNKDRDDLFKVVVLGLLSLDHVNKNKRDINGVVNGNLASVLYYLIGNQPVLIEPPKDNIDMHNKFIPPMNSISKTLKYLNSLNVFYQTPYRFFIDFDCAYLMSSSGKAVKKKGEDISTIFLILRNTFNEASKVQGMIIDEKQSMYQIECDGIDCELADNHISEKSYSTISAINASGSSTQGSLSNRTKDTIVESKNKSIRLANDNTGLLDNMISASDSSAIQLLVQKTYIDSSVLTMNKEYIIKADEVYKTEAYNGRYILTRKRELYIREDTNFVMNTMLLFEKVPGDNIEMPVAISK